ncbi:hypothetical protein EVAR_95031_1 [Eumeta japonica]|uniref:Uncharacterized protein n=1 Tax=Eumeta variegata TaxID=151549 RepID=A0A4C1VUI9_EUMVA|nr:hypothetical protein EVAR_95031_1 [Eumeta japonica]
MQFNLILRNTNSDYEARTHPFFELVELRVELKLQRRYERTSESHMDDVDVPGRRRRMFIRSNTAPTPHVFADNIIRFSAGGGAATRHRLGIRSRNGRCLYANDSKNEHTRDGADFVITIERYVYDCVCD